MHGLEPASIGSLVTEPSKPSRRIGAAVVGLVGLGLAILGAVIAVPQLPDLCPNAAAGVGDCNAAADTFYFGLALGAAGLANVVIGVVLLLRR